jgi:hypothetical protein
MFTHNFETNQNKIFATKKSEPHFATEFFTKDKMWKRYDKGQA